MSFPVIRHIFFFLGLPKIPFFDNLAQKARTPKHYKNRGFSTPIFENNYASRNGHFWTKNSPEIPVIVFLGLFSSLSTTKNIKSAEFLYFLQARQNIFKKNLKQRNLKTPIFAPFLKKRQFKKMGR